MFTLLHVLNRLAATSPRRLYELLFQAVSETLLAFAADPRDLGGTPAFTLVLYTWTQALARCSEPPVPRQAATLCLQSIDPVAKPAVQSNSVCPPR